jgi:diguanylate cyclase (GGDEF)-like protein/PAS domain S-box-containing protein
MQLAINYRGWILIALAMTCIADHCYALDNVTLQLNWTHGFQFAGYYAAKEQGYYQEAGLDVNFEESAPDSDPVPNVSSGKAQFGVGTSSLILARAAGKPVIALAVIFQHSPYVIYTADGTENVRALAGKKIIIEPQADELVAYLKKAGIAQDQIQRLPQGIAPKDLISGKTDAISGHLLNKPYAFELAHFTYRTFSPRENGIDFYGDNLFTSEQEIKDHPEQVHAFLQASLRGWRYALEHRDEIIDLILKKYSTHYAREYLVFESEQMLPLLQSDLIDIGYSTPMRWKRIAEVYSGAGMLQRTVSLDEFIYVQHPVNQIEPAISFWLNPKILIILLIFASIILFSLFILFKLKRKNEELGILKRRDFVGNQVLKLLSAETPLSEVLNEIVANVPANDSQTFCSIVLFDESGKRMRFSSAPLLQNTGDNLQNIGDISSNLPICAPTLKTGQQTIARCISDNPPCLECKSITAQVGFVTCCTEPFLTSSGIMLGHMSIFHRTPHDPSLDDIKQLEYWAHLTGVAVELIQSRLLLQDQHDLFAKVSAEVPGIIFKFQMYPDGRCCFPFMSEAVRKMYGLSPENLKEDATPFFGFRHPEDAESLERSMQESARTLSRWHLEYRLIIPGQGMRWRQGDAMPEKLEDGSIVWYGFITDITDRKNAEERIRHLAQFDLLTNLPNRSLFSDRLGQALSKAKREPTYLALMFIDFDNFKPINDNYGHAVGDKLLTRAAIRMQRCMRESDTLARIGGDEFVALLAETESDRNAQIVGEKIRQSFDMPFEIEGLTLNITVSIGIAIYPDHGEDEIELSKNADCAMYHSKQLGRNIVSVYHNRMQAI